MPRKTALQTMQARLFELQAEQMQYQDENGNIISSGRYKWQQLQRKINEMKQGIDAYREVMDYEK